MPSRPGSPLGCRRAGGDAQRRPRRRCRRSRASATPVAAGARQRRATATAATSSARRRSTSGPAPACRVGVRRRAVTARWGSGSVGAHRSHLGTSDVLAANWERPGVSRVAPATCGSGCRARRGIVGAAAGRPGTGALARLRSRRRPGRRGRRPGRPRSTGRGRCRRPPGCATGRRGRSARRPRGLLGGEARARGRRTSTHAAGAVARPGGLDGDVDRRARRGVGERVGHQVAEHLAQPGLVAEHDRRARRRAPSSVDRAVRVRPPGRRARRRRRARAGRPAPRSSGRCWSSRASSSRSSTSSAHPGRLVLDPAHHPVQLVRLGDRALPVELGEAADRGQRRAQLVAGVGDEPAHPVLGRAGRGLRGLPGAERRLDLAEHRVQRAARAGRPRCAGRSPAPGGSGRRRRWPRPCARPRQRAQAGVVRRRSRAPPSSTSTTAPTSSSSERRAGATVSSTSSSEIARTTMHRSPPGDAARCTTTRQSARRRSRGDGERLAGRGRTAGRGSAGGGRASAVGRAAGAAEPSAGGVSRSALGAGRSERRVAVGLPPGGRSPGAVRRGAIARQVAGRPGRPGSRAAASVTVDAGDDAAPTRDQRQQRRRPA